MGEEKVKKSILKRWWFWLLAVLILIIIISSLGNNKGTQGNNTQNPPATDGTVDIPQGTVPGAAPDIESGTARDTTTDTTMDTTTDIAGAPQDNKAGDATAASVKQGMYKIGSDLPAGEYILTSESSSFPAYYQISKDSTGSLESIISNDNFTGNRYVTAADGQYLEFRSAVGYPANDAPNLRPADGRYNEGMYKVGKDIDPGEYKLIPDENSINSYVEVSKDSKGKLESIISNDNFETEKYITISNGQYLKLVDCHIITR